MGSVDIILSEPGGYLAWGDVTMNDLYKSSIQNPHVRERKPGLAKFVGWQDEQHEWVHLLPEIFREHGLEDVVRHNEVVTAQWLRPWCHLQYLAIEEVHRGAVARLGAENENVKALDQHLKTLKEDAKQGVYTYYEPMIVSGRKPGIA